MNYLLVGKDFEQGNTMMKGSCDYCFFQNKCALITQNGMCLHVMWCVIPLWAQCL